MKKRKPPYNPKLTEKQTLIDTKAFDQLLALYRMQVWEQIIAPQLVNQQEACDEVPHYI